VSLTCIGPLEGCHSQGDDTLEEDPQHATCEEALFGYSSAEEERSGMKKIKSPPNL
jgi:hypothetical protein